MPDTEVISGQPAVPGAEPSAQPVVAPDRAAIIEKYNQTYFGSQASPAVGDITPIEPTVVSTEAIQTSPDVTTAMQALMAEVASLKSRLDEKPAAQPQAAATQEDWLNLLAAGKKADGEKALAAILGPGIQQQAVNQALAIMESKQAINEFVIDVRSKNPELAPMEQYIALAADARIRAAEATGQIKSPADYVKVYKDAITAEIENARTLSRTFQGIGKQAATTRISEVSATPTLTPSPVNFNRQQAVPEGSEAPQSATDYLAERQARHARLSGMATSN